MQFKTINIINNMQILHTKVYGRGGGGRENTIMVDKEEEEVMGQLYLTNIVGLMDFALIPPRNAEIELTVTKKMQFSPIAWEDPTETCDGVGQKKN
jgi:hypothetical protein